MATPHMSNCVSHFCLSILAGMAFALLGCQSGSSGKTQKEPDTSTEVDSGGGTDTDTSDGDTGNDSTVDSETVDPSGGTDSGSSEQELLCPDGLTATPFDEGATQVAYDAPAPDFTVNTTAGEWSLSERWTGCDNYVFVMYHPGYTDNAVLFWSSDIAPLVDDSAPNTHYFFVTLEDALSAEERRDRVMEVAYRIDEYLATKDEATQSRLADRFHYVTDYGRDIPVVDGVLKINAGEVHFTVDRKQLVREGHSVSYYTPQGWRQQLRNTRYWSKYYNAQHLLDAELTKQAQKEDVLVHRVATEEDIPGSVPFVWTLPDAETIAGYEKLEVDMRVGCPGAGHPYGATCGEWDTVGSIFLCGDEECSNESRRRIVKWITPYSAPGRWVIDITPELVALADGGDLRFMAQHGDNDVGPYTYKYTVDFRFSKSKDGLRPFALEPLIPRGNYAFATMADAFDPFSIEAPEGTSKVELYARISGHGAVEGSSCAEFCTFEHTFDVNGVGHRHIYRMESLNRCAEWVERGVTPNQGGTWYLDRSSWCPGWTTEEWREDLTDSFLLDGVNIVEHVPTYHTGPPPGGNMDARVELVYYR